MANRIPPKGQTIVDIGVQRERHGCAVTIHMRSLTLGAKMQADHKKALLFAWRALAGELAARGVNLLAALTPLPETLEREDLSDDSGEGKPK